MLSWKARTCRRKWQDWRKTSCSACSQWHVTVCRKSNLHSECICICYFSSHVTTRSTLDCDLHSTTWSPTKNKGIKNQLFNFITCLLVRFLPLAQDTGSEWNLVFGAHTTKKFIYIIHEHKFPESFHWNYFQIKKKLISADVDTRKQNHLHTRGKTNSFVWTVNTVFSF